MKILLFIAGTIIITALPTYGDLAQPVAKEIEVKVEKTVKRKDFSIRVLPGWSYTITETEKPSLETRIDGKLESKSTGYILVVLEKT